MTTEDAFAADVLADPDDPAARLIWADWLSERDREEEARFLRASLILGLAPRLPRAGDRTGLSALRWWSARQERFVSPWCAWKRWPVRAWRWRTTWVGTQP